VTTIIYFHPEAYTTSGPKLLGCNDAKGFFLRGCFAYVRLVKLGILKVCS